MVVDHAGPGTVTVVIEEAQHLGTHIRASARRAGEGEVDDVADGEHIHLTTEPTRRLAPRDRAFLRLPPEHCHVVPASD